MGAESQILFFPFFLRVADSNRTRSREAQSSEQSPTAGAGGKTRAEETVGEAGGWLGTIPGSREGRGEDGLQLISLHLCSFWTNRAETAAQGRRKQGMKLHCALE